MPPHASQKVIGIYVSPDVREASSDSLLPLMTAMIMRMLLQGLCDLDNLKCAVVMY